MSERHEQKRAAMAQSIETQTGRSVASWVDLVDASGIEGFMPIVDWLKAEHGLGHFQARRVAEAHRDR